MLKTLLLCITVFLYSLASHSQDNKTDSLINLLRTTSEDTNKANLYRKIGISLLYSDPMGALPYFIKGARLAIQLKFDAGAERNYGAAALSYSFATRYDSSLIYADSALIYAKRVKDPSRLALLFLNRGDVYSNMQRFSEALRDCDTALVYAEKSGNLERTGRIYSVMATVYEFQDRYEEALPYVEKAYAEYLKAGNMQGQASMLSDKAMIFNRGRKDYAHAETLLRRAIVIADSIGDYQSLSPYYGELAGALAHQKKYKEAENAGQQAMTYAKQTDQLLQEAVVHDIFFNLYNEQAQVERAIPEALIAYDIFHNANEMMREHSVATNLAEAYTAVGNAKEAYRFMKISRDLKDSLNKQQFNSEIAQLQTTFNVAQKDQEIQLLNKDKEIQKQRLNQQRIILFVSILLAVMAIVGIFLLINRNRLRQRMKELQIRNQIAADLHDEVGSSLSSIHMLSEMAAKKGVENGQQEILARVTNYTSETMEKMGDIVWMIKPAENEGSGLRERMQRFLSEIANSKNIRSEMDAEALDSLKLDMQQRKGVYLVFKEAVNNAAKYSSASTILVTASQKNDHLELIVKDDGKGFTMDENRKGNGLENMQHRAKEMGGSLHIDSKEGQGTAIHLTVPV